MDFAYRRELKNSDQSCFTERVWSNVRLTSETDRARRRFGTAQFGVLEVSNRRAAVQRRQGVGYVTFVESRPIR